MVIDSSVLIAYLDGHDEHHARAVALLVREIDDDFGANSLTIAEVLVGPARAGRIEDGRRVLAELELAEVPFPDSTAVKLAVLRALTQLKMPDCGVLLAAEQLAAQHEDVRVASFDHRLTVAARARGLAVIDA